MIQWSNDPIVRCFWARTSESPEVIAERSTAFVDSFAEQWGPYPWSVANGPRWQGTTEELADLVRARASTAARGTPDPDDGYALPLTSRQPDIFGGLGVHAGTNVISRRLPTHHADLTLTSTSSDSAVPVELGDAAVRSLVTAFDPLMVSLTTGELNGLARRGGWKIPPAYRLWLHNDVGPIHHLFDGVTATPLGNGTLLTVPDDWPPEPVIEAILNTLTYNNLDEIPH